MGARYNLGTLKSMWESGVPTEDIAKFFDRSPNNIRVACCRHKFRRPASFKTQQSRKARAARTAKEHSQ